LFPSRTYNSNVPVAYISVPMNYYHRVPKCRFSLC